MVVCEPILLSKVTIAGIIFIAWFILFKYFSVIILWLKIIKKNDIKLLNHYMWYKIILPFFNNKFYKEK